MAARKFQNPQVVVANRLADGLVVYLGPDGWVPEVDDAEVAQDAEASASLVARGERAMGQNEVVDAYAIDVRLDGDTVTPIANKEAIRAKGPTVRPDLGKQAEI